jgi:hypothetical protein
MNLSKSGARPGHPVFKSWFIVIADVVLASPYPYQRSQVVSVLVKRFEDPSQYSIPVSLVVLSSVESQKGSIAAAYIQVATSLNHAVGAGPASNSSIDRETHEYERSNGWKNDPKSRNAGCDISLTHLLGS